MDKVNLNQAQSILQRMMDERKYLEQANQALMAFRKLEAEMPQLQKEIDNLNETIVKKQREIAKLDLDYKARETEQIERYNDAETKRQAESTRLEKEHYEFQLKIHNDFEKLQVEYSETEKEFDKHIKEWESLISEKESEYNSLLDKYDKLKDEIKGMLK